jgi:hypothetical protein
MHFKQNHLWKLLSFALITGAPVLGFAQNRNPNQPAAPTNGQVQPPVTPTTPRTGPKPYKEVITDKAVTDDGLFKVHKVDEKYYFEIPDSLLGRDILVVNRISKAAAGMRNFSSVMPATRLVAMSFVSTKDRAIRYS